MRFVSRLLQRDFPSLKCLPKDFKSEKWQPALGLLPIFSRYECTSSEKADSGNPLYPGHIPTATWQKVAIAIGSAVGALRNPARADLVASLGETTAGYAYSRMRSKMKVSAEGRKLLSLQPRVTKTTMNTAESFPEGSFGEAYAKFMLHRGFSADERPGVRFVDDPELAFIAARAREVHDFWHVLFNCPTTVTGELALKMVEFVQTGLPMCALSAMGGPLRLKQQRRDLLVKELYPWAVRAGLQAADLMSIYYEDHFGESLEEVREKWRIIPAPDIVSSKHTL